ncbi:MAG TPA: galactokinase [Streptosporangiaceae bacterium]
MTRSADAHRVVAWFRERFGADPDGLWHAPGRANLIGEHTDYNEGFVLPFALDRGTLTAAALTGGSVLDIRSMQVADGGVTVPLDGLEPGQVTGWAAYPAGVAWALREVGYPVGGARLAIDSDLPQGAGLSSSAALECGVALALTQLHGIDVPRPELAALAQRAENGFVGMPSGIMDQSASLLCRASHALLLDCRSGETAAVPLDPAAAGLALLIIDTRARHALTDSGYAARRRECEAAARALGVRSLRDIDDAQDAVSRLADPVLGRRARHVITENHRVLQAVDLMRGGQFGRIGPLLSASHTSLADDFEISWPEADAAVEAAVGAGAPGARMMGGGFGGSVIALVPEDASPVRAAVCAAFDRRGWPAPGFLGAPPSDAARRLS